MKNDDEEFLDTHMYFLNITLGGILLFMLGFVGYMVYDTSQTKVLSTFTEEHVIEITEIDPPKYFTLNFYDHTLKKNVHEYSKRCSAFKEGHFEVGKKYLVTLQYRLVQYKDETPERIMLTSGCDLYDVKPKLVE